MDEQVKNIDIDYDPVSDVMYWSYGPPAEAISVEVSEGVFIRLDPDSNKPVGATIVDFSRRFTQKPGQKVSVPLVTPVEAVA